MFTSRAKDGLNPPKATAGRPPKSRRTALVGALKDQRGSMLIEAVVSATLLLFLSMGFLAALDAAGKSSGSVRSRGVAASLARDDMERLRALKLADLVNLNASRTQVVNGIPYTIRSTTRWVDDVTGDATCSSGSTKTDYLKAVSTVTFPYMGTTQPVVNESLVAVPNGSLSGTTGGLIAKVNGRDGTGLPGVGVTIRGPSVLSGTTDAGGCAAWTAANVGGYYVDLAQAGYVDRSGATNVRKSASVVSGGTNSIAFEYDRAATASVSFDTEVAGVVRPAQATAITYANGGMPQGSAVATSATSATTISTGAKLFPFTDPYAIWGGGCAGADPRAYGASTPMVAFAPAQTQAVTVRLPALRLDIRLNGVAFPTARVRITPATPGCGSTFGTTGLLSTLGGVAQLTNPGLPYGDYNVCVDNGLSGSLARTVSTSTPIQNRSAAGSAVTALNITSTRGTCA